MVIDMSKPHLQPPWTISGGSGVQIHIADPTAKIIQNGKHIIWTDADMIEFASYCSLRREMDGYNFPQILFDEWVKQNKP